MLWPIVTPLKITFWTLAGLVALVTFVAPALKWRRGKTSAIMSLLACLAFIPSCVAIKAILDTQRFGLFQYDAFRDVSDFRVERYLPTRARHITLEKHAAGHRAKYSISESDLMAYLNDPWREYGQYSAVSRDEMEDGRSVTWDSFGYQFKDLGWPPLESAIELHSPVQRDGGGATYFFDRSTGIAYQHAGYW